MKQNKKFIKIFLPIIFFLLALQVMIVVPAQAQPNPGGGAVTCADGQPAVGGVCPIRNPAPGYLVNTDNFPKLAADIIQTLLAVAGAIAVVFLIIGGFRYITASGNEEGMEKAKKTITGAIIGIVIIVLAYAIVAIVNNLLVRPPG